MGRRPPRRLKALRRWLLYHLFFAPLLLLLRRAPMPLVTLLLRGMVEPVAHLATRHTSQRHLRIVFGDDWSEAERRRVARAVTHNFVSGVLEISQVLRHGPQWLHERIDNADGYDFVARYERDHASGFVGVSAHLGNWELLGSWFTAVSSRGLGAVVAHRMPNARLNGAIERIRGNLGMVTFYRDDPPTRPIRHLRSGRSVAMVPDQDVKNLSGMFLDFLGRPAYTPTGPARIALAARAPLVCGFLVRTGGGRFELHMLEPIHPDPAAPREQEIERLTRAWTAEIERAVRRWPEQWAWFHERWRTTPEKLEARGRRRFAAGETDATADD